jgi:CheY-like chemotaxis protein
LGSNADHGHASSHPQPNQQFHINHLGGGGALIDPHLDGLDVLWVDDDEVGNRAGVRQLHLTGARVEFVSDYDGLASMFRGSRRFDVILSDIARYGDPDRGFTDLERLRREREVGATPVIFFTGRVTTARRGWATRLGARGVTNNWDEVLRWLAEIAAARGA